MTQWKWDSIFNFFEAFEFEPKTNVGYINDISSSDNEEECVEYKVKRINNRTEHLYGTPLQNWTKGWRQIHKIKQNRFFYGMFYSWFFAISYQKTSKSGFWMNG